MKEDEIINKITSSKSNLSSDELLHWVQESDENRKEFARYKNLWALLQNGKDIDQKYIFKDFKSVESRIKQTRIIANVFRMAKYAAVILVAIIGGYYLNSLSHSNKIHMNEVYVPNGNRSSIVLPDGSKVWLTNGSKLTYPETFSGKIRDVKLEGEAYFIVNRDEAKPFFVELGKQRVKVLGTEFSVLAYPNDEIVQVDLVTGKVQFDISEKEAFENYTSYLLEPLHSLVLDKTSGTLKKLKVSDSFYKYWQEGIYEFHNEAFVNLASRIERIYGAKVIFNDPVLEECTFTGAFFVDSNIYTIMETFKRASRVPFEYSIVKNQIYINVKKK